MAITLAVMVMGTAPLEGGGVGVGVGEGMG